MAYSKQATTTLISSASLVPNNLSVQQKVVDNATTLGVIHRSTLNIVHLSSTECPQIEVAYDDSGNKDPHSYLLQVSVKELCLTIARL